MAKKEKPKAALKIERASKTRLHTVLLNGEHALLRAFLRAWLSRFNHLHVVAEASNAHDAWELVSKHKPSLILMDFDSFVGANLELLAKLRSGFPKVKVVVYFADADEALAIKLIRTGAAGFVLKSSDSDDMERAVKTVMSGGVYLSPGFLKSLGSAVLIEGVPDKNGKALSPRQGEILKLLAMGLTTKAVAFELKISSKTVDVHKQALMSRIGAKSAVGLVKYAIRSGLVAA